MSIAKYILNDELENLNRQLQRALSEIEELPKGAIVKKRIRNVDCLYLQYRENGKMKSHFIKKDDDLEALKKSLEVRERLKAKIKMLKYEIAEIEKALRHLK